MGPGRRARRQVGLLGSHTRSRAGWPTGALTGVGSTHCSGARHPPRLEGADRAKVARSARGEVMIGDHTPVTTLGVSDLARAREFYEGILGSTPGPR